MKKPQLIATFILAFAILAALLLWTTVPDEEVVQEEVGAESVVELDRSVVEQVPEIQECTDVPEQCYEQAMEIAERAGVDDEEFARVSMLFERSCAGGLAVACHDRAVFAQEGIGQQPDLEEALHYYERACEFGHEPACTTGQLLRATTPQRGPDFWVERCQAGDMEECIQLAIYVESGEESPDGRSAREILEQVCESGFSDGCFWLARHLDAVGSGVSDAEIEAHYLTACHGEMGRACSALARRLDARDAGSAQLLETLSRACDLGDGHGCHHLAIVYRRNDELTEAIAAWQRGCDLWHGESCHHLGQALLDDPDRESSPHFERGCQLGVSSSCFNFAIYLNTQVSPPPFERSRNLFDRACQDNHMQACAYLAIMLQQGQGGPAEPDRAAELNRRACQGGVQMACGHDVPRP